MRRRDDRTPRIEPVDPRGLVPGVRGDLVAGARLDGLLLQDLDLAGADLTGLVLDECRLAGTVLDDARLDGARLIDSVLDRVTGTAVRARGGVLRDALLTGCRFGAAEWFEAEWDRVHLEGCRIDYLSLADSHLADVLITGCTIGELDLRGASVRRLAVRSSPVRELSLAGLRATDLDLRGADLARIDDAASLRGSVVSSEQLLLLAPLLAESLGIEVEP